MRKNFVLVMLGALLLNPRIRRLVVRLLFEVLKDRRLRRLILGLITRLFRG